MIKTKHFTNLFVFLILIIQNTKSFKLGLVVLLLFWKQLVLCDSAQANDQSLADGDKTAIGTQVFSNQLLLHGATNVRLRASRRSSGEEIGVDTTRISIFKFWIKAQWSSPWDFGSDHCAGSKAANVG